MRAIAMKPGVAKPLLAAVLVGAATWVGATPAAPPAADSMQVAATELPIAASSTTAPSTTTTTIAPTTTSAAPTTTAPRPTTTTAARPARVTTTTAQSITRAPTSAAQVVLGPVTAPPPRDISVYRGLGTWVDAYDFSPQYQPSGTPPPVTPESMDDLAAAGVKTLYLQAAKDDIRSPGDLVNPEILGPMLNRAHARGIKVVAWYLPKFYDLDSDMRRFLAMRDFRANGEGFDGIGNDIEWTRDVPNHAERSLRLIELSRRLRAAMGSAAVSAIPLPPVLIETINPKYWPGFPWRELAPLYDVWMPMAYWTNRRGPWRDAYSYMAANIDRVRAHIGQPAGLIHALGGIGDTTSVVDLQGFRTAALERSVLGGSIYDFRTTQAPHWPELLPFRELRG
jgi:hypothetical protein